ncbi:MAG: hypothetical protein KKB82_07970 [Candidatus Omnitrophica bacterium]|nr:hypothetical protein [Candidatus Omnitrophota bacterium]
MLLYDIGPYKTQREIGGFAGVSLICIQSGSGDSVSYSCFDVQARFVDEFALSIDFTHSF